MSRNLGRQDCRECPGSDLQIVLEEEPRPVNRADIGENMFHEYEGLIVANAHCAWCHTQYLAWVLPPNSWGSDRRESQRQRENNAIRFIDLSYRSTFNDEPGPKDIPLFEVELKPKALLLVRHAYLRWADGSQVRSFRAVQAQALIEGKMGVAAVTLGHLYLQALDALMCCSELLPSVVVVDGAFVRENVASILPKKKLLLDVAPIGPVPTTTRVFTKERVVHLWSVLADAFETHEEKPMAQYARGFVQAIEKGTPHELTCSADERSRDDRSNPSTAEEEAESFISGDS